MIASHRHQSRIFVMQALFQWYFTQESPDILLQDFIVEHVTHTKSVDLPYLRQLFLETVKHADHIDQTLTPFLNRGIATLNPLELSVLRMAMAELQYHPE